MGRALKRLAAVGAAILGIGGLGRRLLPRNARFVLLFHGIPTRRYRGIAPLSQAGIPRDGLRSVLLWVGSRFRFLSPPEFFATDEPGVLLTFDDGLANNFTNALPVLEEIQAPALFFVATQHVRDPGDWLPFSRLKARAQWAEPRDVPREVARDLFDGLSRDQLVALARHPLVTIGGHSVSHALLTACSDRDLDIQLKTSRRELEETCATKVDLFAYPSGEYDARVIGAVEAAGYTHAFAVKRLGVGRPKFEIPRLGIYDWHASYLHLKLSGLLHRPLSGREWANGGQPS
ncbi:MAG: polysaccharide deacetylase family protein [Acidobacteriota bacterium]